jgi:hypothetical protein
MFQILEEISKKIVDKGFEVMGKNLPPKSDGPVSNVIKGAGGVVEQAQKGAEKVISPNQDNQDKSEE